MDKFISIGETSVLSTTPLPERKLWNRFWAKVDIGKPQSCWDWVAHRDKLGNGKFYIDRKHSRCAFRVAYVLTKGNIPDDYDLIHLCDNILCCNPLHIIAVKDYRFWSKVEIGPKGRCWNWKASKDRLGYGNYSTRLANGRMDKSHRKAYTLTFGQIPEGLEIDHLCRNRACCNPWHLEAVTHQVNMSRAHNAIKVCCPRGHDYSPENTYIYKGRRNCCECHRIRNQEYAKRRCRIS